MSNCSRCKSPLKGYGRDAFYCAECNFPPKPRKPVQIAGDPSFGIVALADDGTIWHYPNETGWHALPPLPVEGTEGEGEDA